MQEYAPNYDHIKYKTIIDVYNKYDKNTEESNADVFNEDEIFEKSDLFNTFYRTFCQSIRAAVQDKVLIKTCKEQSIRKVLLIINS